MVRVHLFLVLSYDLMCRYVEVTKMRAITGACVLTSVKCFAIIKEQEEKKKEEEEKE